MITRNITFVLKFTMQLTSTAAALVVDGLVTQIAGPWSLEHFAPKCVTLSVRFRLQPQTQPNIRRVKKPTPIQDTSNLWFAVL
jgi:hypothetical protein